MRFMHIADVHLGAVPDSGKPWSAQRAKSLWQTFAETVAEAGRQQVDFLLIAGDLFHKQPLKRELKEVNYLFSQIPKVKVVFLAGNHDHMQPKCYYLDFEWAKNVFFFRTEEITGMDFPEENVTIYGMSYWHKKITKRCYDAIDVKNPNRINLLLAHGGDDTHIPYSAGQVLAQGIDYIAAGHIHIAGQLVEGRAVMAGALEPVEASEIGPHGYWIGEITKTDGRRLVSCHFFPVKKCEYCNEKIEVTPQMTMFEIKARIEAITAAGEAYKRYRIFLEGTAEAGQMLDIAMLEELPQVATVLVNLKPDYDYEKIVEEQPDSLLARYIGQIQKLPQDVITKKAMEYGVNALLGHDICR